MSNDSSARQATRTRILDATEELLQTTASHHFKVADVAGRAGVSPSLVIQYFNTKDELVFEACLRMMLRVGPDLYRGYLEGEVKAGLWEFLQGCLRRDIKIAHITVDLLSLSWRWSAQDEQRFTEALAPRRQALIRLLGVELAPTTPSRALVAAVESVYAGLLREALVNRVGADQAFGELRERLSLLLAGVRR